MEKVLGHRHWQKEKGLTIIEMIVSLAVLLIIAISTLSFSLFSISQKDDTRFKHFFMLECSQISNLILIYQGNEFNSALKFYMNNTDDSFTFDDSSDATCDLYYGSDYSYSTDAEYRYKMNLTVSNNRKELNMNVYNNEDVLKFSRSVTR